MSGAGARSSEARSPDAGSPDAGSPTARRPLWLAGAAHDGVGELEVRDPWDGATVGLAARADGALVEAALAAGAAAAPELAAWPAHRRRAVLEQLAAGLVERREVFARLLAREVGKTLAEAAGEVDRAIDTFGVAAGLATGRPGQLLPLDESPRGDDFEALTRRVPLGLCGFITPFNFPLNLAAHKLAPALAVGCPFVLKPASATPLSSLALGELLAETDLPAGSWSILPCPHEAADALCTDERPALLSFTGSQDVGWRLKARAGRKRVTLELGGNAAAIVDADAADELPRVVTRLTQGAFGLAGQSCISVQRVFVHRSLWEPLVGQLVERARGLRVGAPLAADTDVGPLIDTGERDRVRRWIEGAVGRGARLLCGGEVVGGGLSPAWLTDVPADDDLAAREVFGPVATLTPFDDFEAALALADDSDYGLQAGVFTRDRHHAWAAWERLHVGGVVIGDVPTTRIDAMPYGGVKASGSGREGVRWAMESMSELRLMLLRRDRD